MAEGNQPRPTLRSSQSHSQTRTSHPLASSSTAHPSITRRASNNTAAGVPLAPSVSLPASQGQSSSRSRNDYHSPPPAYHRPHAKTISVSRPTRRPGNGVGEADLLGVGSSQRPTKRSGYLSTISSPALSAHTVLEDERETTSIPQLRSPRPRRADSSDSRDLVHYLDSLGKEEMDIVETRFDLMSDDELYEYLVHALAIPNLRANGEATTSTHSVQPPSPLLDDGVLTDPAEARSQRSSTPDALEGDKSPLFPPSPPLHAARIEPREHPLRVLSRAVTELREVIAKLEVENERLKRAQVEKKATRRDKSADKMSIHDGLTEAISTSLTSTSPISQLPSDPLVIPDDAISLRPASPTLSISRSVRPRSTASSISVPFPASPIDSPAIANTSASTSSTSGLSTPVAVAGKRVNRNTWTSGLWAWNTGKKPRPREGSESSVASANQGAAQSPSIYAQKAYEPEPVDGDEDEEAWRRGDGGSSPGFKAVFLATRIITPDPSSILVSSEIPSNSLIAYLAHSLVSHARDQGIVARDAISDRRRSRDFSRSRATSIIGQDQNLPSPDPSSAPPKDPRTAAPGYGYGDQALAATASLGRSLLSSVSYATIRGTRAITNMGEESRPSLLNRASSGRGFPTTAISAPIQPGQSSSSTASPMEERPLPSVELASIVPDESRPPTVLLSRHNLGSFFQASKGRLHTASRFEGEDEPLTDRYGFIYDIQHAKMLKDASAAGTSAPMSLNGSLPPPSTESESEGWIAGAQRRRGSQGSHRSAKTLRERERKAGDLEDGSSVPSPRRSLDSSFSGNVTVTRSRTPDSVTPPEARSAAHTSADTHRHRSSTLLSLNPSPAKTVTAKEHLTVSSRGASSLQPDVVPSSSSTLTPPLSASLAHASSTDHANTANSNVNASRLTISSLLDQLTEIHDRQQKERQVEWDAFLRRRARHRASASTSIGKDNKSDDLRWGSGLIGVSQMGLTGKGGQEDWKAFARLVRKGIPLKYRSDIWAECSGAKDLMVPGEYAEILTVHKSDISPVQADIEKDVSRTFPGNVFFGGDGPGVGKLRRVLTAYSWHNPAVGYCQGMNMLAATLLLTHTDEEQAYWVLTSLIDRLLPASFYSPSLLASRADQQVLTSLVMQLVPKVHAHLDQLGVDLASVTFGWWLSLFTDCLPVETLFRVWDVFFVEGHDTLFRVAIAILKLNEAEICATESVSDLFTFISTMTSRLWNADKLIGLQHSYKPIIRHIDVVARCEKAVAELQQEMGEGDDA